MSQGARSESLDRLVTMHAYCRPAGSATELAFVDRYLKPLGVTRDRYGNYSLVVGDRPELVWSCHTDTVHRVGGSQRVVLAADGVLSAPLKRLKKKRKINGYTYVDLKGVSISVPDRWMEYEAGSGCLGADDTAGVWLMAELIRLGVPGRYLFHYGEEEGCQGSRALADDCPSWIADARYILALDRRDTRDIITHQCGRRTASDAFARSLADQLNKGGNLRYSPSDRGLYTDSESYADLVPECTNLSIGYAGNHSQAETLDTDHCLLLLSALAAVDVDALVCQRDPAAERRRVWSIHRGQWVSDGFPDLDDDWDPSLPVATSVDCYYCHSCGAYCEADDAECEECGVLDPADDYATDAEELTAEQREARQDLRKLFLDQSFADAQSALQAQVTAASSFKLVSPGVVPSRCCRWGGCNGVGPVGGFCNRCGTKIASSDRELRA